MNFKNKKFYIIEDGVNFRSTPDTSIQPIRKFKHGEEVTVVEEPWVLVECGGQRGWVRADYLIEVSLSTGDAPRESIAEQDQLPKFVPFQPNLADSPNTKFIRKSISYEFKFEGDPEFKKTPLQCTEYVQFRVKQKLGITIKWPPDRPRDGKYWADIFARNKLYETLIDPAQNCAMSFTEGFKTPVMQRTGHVAFVEEVSSNSSIRISEANWDNRGSYQERILTEEEWRNYWRGKFVDFS